MTLRIDSSSSRSAARLAARRRCSTPPQRASSRGQSRRSGWSQLRVAARAGTSARSSPPPGSRRPCSSRCSPSRRSSAPAVVRTRRKGRCASSPMPSNREDPLAAADVLAPEEVQSLSQSVDAAAKRAQELALAKDAAAPLAGLDLSVDNLDLATETMADGYVKVTVTNGTLSAHTEKDKFSPVMQQALRNTKGNWSTTNLATLAKSLDLPTFVMAVERGGHWYVSAAYTTLEYIREANQLPPADFGSGARATATLGAETPDLAVTEAMQALAQSDWRKLISLAPPDRAAGVRLPRCAGPARSGHADELHARQARNDGHDRRRHRESFAARFGQYGLGSVGARRRVLQATARRGNHRRAHQQLLRPRSAVRLPFSFARPSTAQDVEVTVVRRDGRWFVSPVGTVLDLLDRYVRDATQRQLYTLLGVPEQLPPDGTLTLGEPVTPDDSLNGAYVYALDAHRGDRFLGLVTTDAASGESYSGAEVLVYSSDGEVLSNSYDLIDGRGLTIPADGTYKVVVRPYYQRTTFTVWDAAQAPEAAKHPPNEGMYDGCRPTSNGGEMCSSSGSSSPGSSSSSSSSSSSIAGVSGQCVTRSDGITECRDVSSSSSLAVRATARLRRPASRLGWLSARSTRRPPPTVAISSAAVCCSRPRSCTGSRADRGVDCAVTGSSMPWSRSVVMFRRCRPVGSRSSGISFPRSGPRAGSRAGSRDPAVARRGSLPEADSSSRSSSRPRSSGLSGSAGSAGARRWQCSARSSSRPPPGGPAPRHSSFRGGSASL